MSKKDNWVTSLVSNAGLNENMSYLHQMFVNGAKGQQTFASGNHHYVINFTPSVKATAHMRANTVLC